MFLDYSDSNKEKQTLFILPHATLQRGQEGHPLLSCDHGAVGPPGPLSSRRCWELLKLPLPRPWRLGGVLLRPSRWGPPPARAWICAQRRGGRRACCLWGLQPPAGLEGFGSGQVSVFSSVISSTFFLRQNARFCPSYAHPTSHLAHALQIPGKEHVPQAKPIGCFRPSCRAFGFGTVT